MQTHIYHAYSIHVHVHRHYICTINTNKIGWVLSMRSASYFTYKEYYMYIYADIIYTTWACLSIYGKQ